MNSFEEEEEEEEEEEARQRLHRALATMTPRPAPAAMIKARGRAITRRRRVALAGLLAGVAALAVAAPGLLHKMTPGTEPPRLSAGPWTVNKPGPVAGHGVIGSGTLNGNPWTVWLTGGPDPVAEAAGLPATGAVGTRPDGTAPATFRSSGSGTRQLLAGPVSPDVAYLTMQLADGTVFTVYPDAWHGHDYIGLVVPKNLGVVRFTAYSRHGELAYAIPFPASGFPDIVSWLRPGAAVPSTIEMTVGSETYAVNWWTVEAQIGPWGTCLVQTSGSGAVWCVPHRTAAAGRGHLGDARPRTGRGDRHHRPGRCVHPADDAGRQDRTAAGGACGQPGFLRPIGPASARQPLDRLQRSREARRQRDRRAGVARRPWIHAGPQRHPLLAAVPHRGRKPRLRPRCCHGPRLAGRPLTDQPSAPASADQEERLTSTWP
jgi:hypothetical protein